MFKRLRDTTDRIVIPACGQFTIAKCALEAGYNADEIECSDISFFTSVLGYLHAGKPLSELPMTLQEQMSLMSHEPEHVALNFRSYGEVGSEWR